MTENQVKTQEIEDIPFQTNQSADEKSLMERFDKMTKELMVNKGFSKRKAVRFLNALSRRSIEKMMNKGSKKINQVLKRHKVLNVNYKKENEKQHQIEYAEQIKQQLEQLKTENPMPNA